MRYPLYLHRLISERNQWVISIYAWVYAAGVCYASFRNLPVLEFTPYTVGADLRGAVEGTAKTDDGGISPLANFYLNTPQGDDCTFEVLADTSWQFLLIAPNCATADDGCCDRINSLYDYCVDKGYAFRMATASAPQDIYDWIDRTGAAYPILLADETELKSAVRANPGLMLLHDGRIAAKWSNNNLPEYRDEDERLELRRGRHRHERAHLVYLTADQDATLVHRAAHHHHLPRRPVGRQQILQTLSDKEKDIFKTTKPKTINF